MSKIPLTAKLRVQIDLSNGHWVELSRYTFEDNTIASADFNWDDDIDSSKMEEAINKLQEAIL